MDCMAGNQFCAVEVLTKGIKCCTVHAETTQI